MNVFSTLARVVADAELRTVGSQQVANVRLASDTGFGDRKSTLWINGAVWGARAEKLAPMLVKGGQVFVSGELSQREYQAKDGGKGLSLELRIAELQFAGSKVDGGQRAAAPANGAQMADEIPF
ncbi:MAG TPA: single-stranded DNA-binding protein [Amaricoccus sp.]|uniref:single-stranded DNA-binding protein n=1 Tax=Amaricoccus sp. TaxID=1872485 RepID=UPI002CA510B7|nr:single-stranded DNA-binding protein [Amaricoccus sp.]HMQ92494.1 single-stranded DNA-binding protein [Amaricoccus sp.]HMR53857.1 single-stranded DNA-binding protein [Amaricoccus sp.]HMR58974.1 single-stranded DNA-binding protein [Amaricoccus sp.]HMU00852.1 single-stranded DNA-binding protein [Amaricoccus sp.]